MVQWDLNKHWIWLGNKHHVHAPNQPQPQPLHPIRRRHLHHFHLWQRWYVAESRHKSSPAVAWHASEASAAEEGRDQCPTPEHPVPDHLSKDCQSAEGQAPAKPHLTDGKTAAANEAATVCQEDPLKSTMSLNGSFLFAWSDSYCSAQRIYIQWQSVLKK